MFIELLRFFVFLLLTYDDIFAQASSIEQREEDCNCWEHDGSGARIAYLITMHNEQSMRDGLSLFRAIRSPNSIILFHVDVKFRDPSSSTSWKALETEMNTCSCGAKTELVSRFDCKWGTWSMNDPTHWSMKYFIEQYPNQWDVYINLSGDTLPVLRPQILSQILDKEPLKNLNFVTSAACETGLLPTPLDLFPPKWHKRQHYHHMKSHRFHNTQDGSTIELPIHFGSQWMMLQYDFVAHFVHEFFYDPKSLAIQLKYALISSNLLMTDETFIPTLYMHWKDWFQYPDNKEGLLIDSSWTMRHVRFERMDEHALSAFSYIPRFDRYRPVSSNKKKNHRPWGPYYLGVYDYHSIRHSGALFVRKVSQEVDQNIYHHLPVNHHMDIPDISWPIKGVEIEPSLTRKVFDKHDIPLPTDNIDQPRIHLEVDSKNNQIHYNPSSTDNSRQ